MFLHRWNENTTLQSFAQNNKQKGVFFRSHLLKCVVLVERIGLPTVIFSYAAMSFVLVVFVIVFVPETKGRSLEQISKELAMK